MPIKYQFAPNLQKQAVQISKKLFPHIKIQDMRCFRSLGSKSRGTIARCHALGKIMQLALCRNAVYVLEFISERFDKLPDDEKTKVIIHELMHIPKTFGGGFKHHDFVTEKNVNKMYDKYIEMKEKDGNNL